MSTAVNQRVACKAVIGLGDKVLVLREGLTYEEGTNLGKWQFPGGRINPGEHFLDGLKREVMEETGLTIEPGDPLFVSEWFPVIKGQQNHIVAIFFACMAARDTQEADVRLSEEHDVYRWVTQAEAETLGLLSSEQGVLAGYFGRFAKQ